MIFAGAAIASGLDNAQDSMNFSPASHKVKGGPFLDIDRPPRLR
jgi:hypothetical protein